MSSSLVVPQSQLDNSASKFWFSKKKNKQSSMSACLSNLPISHPISYQRTSAINPTPLYSRFPHSVSPVRGKNSQKESIKAMAAVEGGDNLDHLQRVTKHQSNQPRRRSPQVAPPGLWDRFPTARTVQQMMETMERMMEDPFAYNSGWPSPPVQPEYSRGRTPWDIKESEGEYKMRFDMPGMTKEDVKLWVEEKMLVVKAEKLPRKNGEEGYNGDEEWPAKSYGRYNSRIALPENVQFEKIKAEVKDGVLYITIPKASNNPKILDINVE